MQLAASVPALSLTPYASAAPWRVLPMDVEKLSPELMHSQIEVFAKVIHKMDGLPAAQLKG